MKDDDPRKEYVSLISIEKSSLILSPPIVFLFGGELSNPPQSVRAQLYLYLSVRDPKLFRSLVIPEHFEDWLHDSIYPDLLTFESDLAETASLIIIALESPGAIAELGCFSVNEGLREKIIVIVNAKHHDSSSFIKLGPLRQLPEGNVFCYPYDLDHPASSIEEYIDDIIINVNAYLDKRDKTELFDRKKNGHIAILIYELILMFKALKLTEIKEYLNSLSFEVPQNVIKRLLFLLQKLLLVQLKRVGNIDYYLPTSTEQRIKFASKNSTNLFDRNAAVIGTALYYAKSPKEAMRKKLIEREEGSVS